MPTSQYLSERDALMTMAYILHLVPSKSISTTPCELWMGRRHDLSYMGP